MFCFIRLQTEHSVEDVHKSYISRVWRWQIFLIRLCDVTAVSRGVMQLHYTTRHHCTISRDTAVLHRGTPLHYTARHRCTTSRGTAALHRETPLHYIARHCCTTPRDNAAPRGESLHYVRKQSDCDTPSHNDIWVWRNLAHRLTCYFEAHAYVWERGRCEHKIWTYQILRMATQ